MSRKTLLLAFLSLPCLGLATEACAQQTPEIARDVQNVEREWQDNQKAIEDDTECIRLQDEEAEERCRRVWSAAFQGDLPQAMSAFREFQAACLGRKTAYLHRARCYETAGAWNKTIADCTEVVWLDPRNAAAYSMRGASHNYNHEYDKALADCNQALALDPKYAEAYVNRGHVWMQEGETDKALADCNQALSLNPNDADAYSCRARVWEKKGKYDELMADCNRALALNPKIADAYIGRGIAWDEKGEYDKAIADFNHSLALNPRFAEAYNCRSLVWDNKREYDKAIADCNQALALNPKLAEAYSNRGQAWNNKGKYDKAIADCNQALALNPKLANAYINRGVAWCEKGEREKAIDDWENALAIAPDNYNALNNFGVFLWQKAQEQDDNAAKAEADGNLDAAKAYHQKSVVLKNDAKAHWNRGIAIHPTATDIHSNLGYAYSEANDLDSAERHLREAVRIKPLSPRPRNNLGRVLLRRCQQCEAEAREAEAKGKADPAEAARAKHFNDEAKVKLDAAIEQFEKAVELDPWLLEARLNLGEVYLSQHDLDKAEAQYRAVVRLPSPSIKDWDAIGKLSQAHAGLARVAIARKKSDEAVGFLQQSLELNPRNAAAMQMLAVLRFQRGEIRDGEKCLWRLLAALPAAQRLALAEQFGKQLETTGKTREAVRAWTFLGWTFATSPEP
ncbi:MAG: tetratricopeptide repeat protein, partial [Thermoguttaceae bacterium]